jgi:hypothetical protein
MGEGARAFAMANNYVALSGDLSAMFWNPAGFAFVPARELQISFDGLSQRTASTFLGNDGSATNAASSVSRPRLVDIGYMHAFPTVQGGFTLAASYHSTYLFDNVQAVSGTYYPFGSVLDAASVTSEQKSYGGLDMWSAGFGLQVAKGLGIGAAVSVVSGRGDGSFMLQRITNGGIADPVNDYYDGTTNDSYIGYDIRLGLLYSFLQRYSIGVRLVVPQTIWFTENQSWNFQYSPDTNYSDSYTGKLFSSFSGAIGGAAKFPFLTVSMQDPLAKIPDTSLAAKTMLGAGIGLEAPLGVSWVLARAGFSWDQFDTHLFVKQYDGEDPGWDPQGLSPVGNRLQGTVGMGFIIKNVMLEWAYGFDTWKLETKGDAGTLDETHVQQRLLASLSFRF